MTDLKEQRITYMNACGHAVNILIHNSKGESVDPREVIKLARKLAFVALSPQLDSVKEELTKDDKNT